MEGKGEHSHEEGSSYGVKAINTVMSGSRLLHTKWEHRRLNMILLINNLVDLYNCYHRVIIFT